MDPQQQGQQQQQDPRQMLMMLLQKFQQQRGGQPQGEGSPAPSSDPQQQTQSGGPQVKTDPNAQAGHFPMPVASPTKKGMEGSGPIGALIGLVSQHFAKKDQKEHGEAANIATNLMQAYESKDTAKVYEILHDPKSTKVLNKIYKGWLTKAEEMNKPGEEPDPTVSGFEAGLQKYMKGKGPQPEMPKQMGGYMLPQAGPAEQTAGIKTSAENQAAKQDPARTMHSRLNSEEMRSGELGAGPEKVAAEKARAEAVIKKSAGDVQIAQADMQRSQTALKKAEADALMAGKKGDAALAELNVKHLTALVGLDIAKARLGNELAKSKGIKTLSFMNKQKISAVTQAEEILNKIVKENRGFNQDDVKQLDSILRAAGATELAKDLPGAWTRWARGVGSVQDTLDALKPLKQALEEAAGGKADVAPKAVAASDDTTDDEPDGTDSEGGEVMDMEYDAQGNKVTKLPEKP